MATRPTSAPVDLLVLFDGRAYLDYVPTPIILDNLIAEGRLPPTVAVIVGNPDPATRSRELPCHAPFAAFLADELLPWVRANYRVATDPARVTIGGSSYGGLAASYAALAHPELFGRVLSQSGSYWWAPGGERRRTNGSRLTSPRRVPWHHASISMSAFTKRARCGEGGPDQIVANWHFRDALRANGYRVAYAEFVGGHDYLCWRGTLADGLLALASAT